jgi:hypothetical protein
MSIWFFSDIETVTSRVLAMVVAVETETETDSSMIFSHEI